MLEAELSQTQRPRAAYALPILFGAFALAFVVFSWLAPFMGHGYLLTDPAERFAALYALCGAAALQWLAIWIAWGDEPTLPRIVGGLASAGCLAIGGFVGAVLFCQGMVNGWELLRGALTPAAAWILMVLGMLLMRLLAILVARLVTPSASRVTSAAQASLTRTLLILTGVWSVLMFLATKINTIPQTPLIDNEMGQDFVLEQAVIGAIVGATGNMLFCWTVYNPVTRWLVFRRIWPAVILGMLGVLGYFLVLSQFELDEGQWIDFHYMALGLVVVFASWILLGYCGYELSWSLTFASSQVRAADNTGSVRLLNLGGSPLGALIALLLLLSWLVPHWNRFRHTLRAPEIAMIQESRETPSLSITLLQPTTNDDLAFLQAFENATELEHGWSENVDRAGLVHLRHLNRITQLEIFKAARDEDLVHLSHLPLSHLDISDSPINGKGFSHLPPTLTDLHARRCRISEQGVKLLSGREVTTLDLRLQQSPISHDMLASLPSSLTTLMLSGNHLDDQDLANLAHLESLSWLSLAKNRITGIGFGNFRGRQLETLRLSDNPVNDHGVHEIARFKNLRFLLLNETQVTNSGLKDIATLPELAILYLNGTAVNGELGVLLSTKVSQLSLVDTEVDDDAVREIAKLPHLRVLNLSKCRKVTDAGIAHLAGSKLTDLDIDGTQATAAVVASLKQMPGLRTVRVSWPVAKADFSSFYGYVEVVDDR